MGTDSVTGCELWQGGTTWYIDEKFAIQERHYFRPALQGAQATPPTGKEKAAAAAKKAAAAAKKAPDAKTAAPGCPAEEHDNCCRCASDEYPDNWDNG